jgi:oligopeptide transport system ATP-binding protein
MTCLREPPETLLDVRGLTVDFGAARILDAVSLTVGARETVGLVGESGSGKSTLARAILRLQPVSRGVIGWRGVDLARCDARTLRRQRRDLQIVFQDPLSSLDPRMTVGDTLGEPLAIFEPKLDARQRRSEIASMLERVGLAAEMADRYPHEFSGGQCQRIGIARAMMLRPKLLVCDEPVSALDVSIQGQIVNLLLDLQRDFGMSMLFISHNLALVRHLCHRVIVMYAGRVVESAASEVIFTSPVHPYTRALRDAVPDPKLARSGAPALLGKYLPAAAAVLTGCAYRGRCLYAEPGCAPLIPPLETVADGHEVACHRRRELVYS